MKQKFRAMCDLTYKNKHVTLDSSPLRAQKILFQINYLHLFLS